MDAIDRALRKKGLSDSAASKLAVGNSALLKNMRSQSSGEKRYSAQSLKRLADVLGLEFYFGEPKSASIIPWGFSEASWARADETTRTDAFQHGYLPIPYHRSAGVGYRGAAPIAFSKKYLISLGVEPENLSFVVAATAPDRSQSIHALVNATASHDTTPALWAYAMDDQILISHLSWPTHTTILIESLEHDVAARVIDAKEPAGFRPIGQVIWTANEEI